jgi:hypothetical protein
MADAKSGQAQFAGGEDSQGFLACETPFGQAEHITKVTPMAKSTTALSKTPSPVTSTVVSIAAPFTAIKAVLRPKSAPNIFKNLTNKGSLLLCPPQLPTKNQQPIGQGISAKTKRNPTKLMLIPGSIINRELLRANLPS